MHLHSPSRYCSPSPHLAAHVCVRLQKALAVKAYFPVPQTEPFPCNPSNLHSQTCSHCHCPARHCIFRFRGCCQGAFDFEFMSVQIAVIESCLALAALIACQPILFRLQNACWSQVTDWILSVPSSLMHVNNSQGIAAAYCRCRYSNSSQGEYATCS